jgi:bacteriorhodopsin
MVSSLLTVLIFINCIFFFTLFIKSVSQTVNPKYEGVIKADIAILGVAFTQYALTFLIENSNVLVKDSMEFAQQLRYVDWTVTTPFLLYSFWKLAEIEGYTGDFGWLLFAVLVMMIFGILAEFFALNFKIKMILFTIGCLGYAYIFIEVLRIMSFFRSKSMSNKSELGYFFLIGWMLYPIAFFLPFESKFILFSFADFINKGLYSIALVSTFD